MTPRQPSSERVLILAPVGRDASALAQLLADSRIQTEICTGLRDLRRKLDVGAGAAVVVEEALSGSAYAELIAWVREQPPWSDLPFIVVTSSRTSPLILKWRQQVIEALRNVELIERPLHALNIRSSVLAALRGRRRQYEVRAYLEARERSERTLSALVAERTQERDRMWELSQDLLVVIGAEGIITAANPAWKTILGYSENEVVGREFWGFIHPDDLPTIADATRRAVRERLPPFENRYRRKDGSYRWISWVAAPAAGMIYGIGRDIDAAKAAQKELDRAQDALRQAQKMEAVGQLTGGIAHDFNNLLQGVIGSLNIAERRLAQGRVADVPRMVASAMTAANRAAALTQRLLAFSRRQPLDPKPVTINPLVSSMEDLLRRTMGERINVKFVLPNGLWPTLCDPNQLESGLLNLAINARDAMPDGGTLTIETCNAHIDEAYASTQKDIAPGQYVCVCVSDTGVGMADAVKERAFDPFFTTKPLGQGTGLGLSMVYGFARQSQGAIRIYSEVGQGTTVKLYLPRHRGEISEDSGPATSIPMAAHKGNEVVLVVEDEAIVRELIVDVLRDLGYRTLTAHDGPSGLEILLSDARIDLLVTDIGLPGLNGRQIADAARLRRPSLKVLFMTGYAENAAIGSGVLLPGMALITKPFAMEDLAARVQEMLQRESV